MDTMKPPRECQNHHPVPQKAEERPHLLSLPQQAPHTGLHTQPGVPGVPGRLGIPGGALGHSTRNDEGEECERLEHGDDVLC